jgi:hypothetical protein
MTEPADGQSVDGYESDDSDDGDGKPKERCFSVAPTVAGKSAPQKPKDADRASDCFPHSGHQRLRSAPDKFTVIVEDVYLPIFP